MSRLRFRRSTRDVRIGIRLAGVLCGLLLCIAVSAFAQEDQSFPSMRNGGVYQDDASKDVNPETATDADEREPVALPAERIIDDLRRQPELIPYVKQLADQSDINQAETGRMEGDQQGTSQTGSG